MRSFTNATPNTQSKMPKTASSSKTSSRTTPYQTRSKTILQTRSKATLAYLSAAIAMKDILEAQNFQLEAKIELLEEMNELLEEKNQQHTAYTNAFAYVYNDLAYGNQQLNAVNNNLAYENSQLKNENEQLVEENVHLSEQLQEKSGVASSFTVCNYGVCSSDVSLVCWVCDDKHGNEKRFCCLECLEGWQALHGDWD